MRTRGFAIGSSLLTVSLLATLPFAGATDAVAADPVWPPIDQVALPACTFPPLLLVQPPLAAAPDALPALADLPELAAARDCFAQTVRAQAWDLYERNVNAAPEHRFKVGAIHFLAHEGNIDSSSTEVLVSYVRMLRAGGARWVGVHLGFFPWLCPADDAPGCDGAAAARAKYDALFATVNEEGLRARLMLPIAPSARLTTEGWLAYRDAAASLVNIYHRPGGNARTVLDRKAGAAGQQSGRGTGARALAR